MTSQPKYDHTLKLFMLGDSDVGKTHLLDRFIKDEFQHRGLSTFGISFETKSLVINNKQIKLQIWDSSGRQYVLGTTKSYLPGSHGFILVYAITETEGFENLPFWMDLIQDMDIPDAPIVLIAAKSDCEIDRKVTTAQGQEFADKFGMHFYETSAKDDVNVLEAFTDIVHQTFRSVLDREAPQVINNDAHFDVDCEKKHQRKGCIIQ